MEAIDILVSQTKTCYPNLQLDIASANKYEIENNLEKAARRYKEIGRIILKLNLTTFSIDYYLKASELFIKCEKYEQAISTELTIFQIHRVVSNINKMASTYEKIGSLFKYYMLNYESAGTYYFMSAKLHEENQNYYSAFKKARFACECFDMTNNITQRINSHSLAFRMALQSRYFEKAGLYAKKWFELIPRDYSTHYISLCMKGYKSFMGSERNEETLMFVNEIIIAHYEKNKRQDDIVKLLHDAQKFYIIVNKAINSDYNQKILQAFSNNTNKKVNYSIEFKSYSQNLGLDSVADTFYLQEKNFSRQFAKETKNKQSYIILSLWKYSCSYGTSLFRWFGTSLIIITIFGFLYSHYEITFSNVTLQHFCEIIKPSLKITSVNNAFSPFYYSVVTFATLGYGDITPSDLSGQIFCVIEVLSGYLMLGGLLSVFSKKIIR